MSQVEMQEMIIVMIVMVVMMVMMRKIPRRIRRKSQMGIRPRGSVLSMRAR